jgi:hypothetical protein
MSQCWWGNKEVIGEQLFSCKRTIHVWFWNNCYLGWAKFSFLWNGELFLLEPTKKIIIDKYFVHNQNCQMRWNNDRAYLIFHIKPLSRWEIVKWINIYVS